MVAKWVEFDRGLPSDPYGLLLKICQVIVLGHGVLHSDLVSDCLCRKLQILLTQVYGASESLQSDVVEGLCLCASVDSSSPPGHEIRGVISLTTKSRVYLSHFIVAHFK